MNNGTSHLRMSEPQIRNNEKLAGAENDKLQILYHHPQKGDF